MIVLSSRQLLLHEVERLGQDLGRSVRVVAGVEAMRSGRVVDVRDRCTGRFGRFVAASAVETGGILIVATFAPDGPDSCAGLEVRRYDVAALAEAFAPDFELIEGRRLIPIAEAGDQRPYIGVALRRTR